MTEHFCGLCEEEKQFQHIRHQLDPKKPVERKILILRAVHRTMKEYGKTLQKLGQTLK